MNPPWKHEIVHIKKAYNLLKDGGKLVALTHTTSQTSYVPSYVQYRQWLESVDYKKEPLTIPCGDDTLNALILVIDKDARRPKAKTQV